MKTLPPPVLLLLAITLMAIVHGLFNSPQWIGSPDNRIGIIIFLGGIVVGGRAIMSFRAAKTNINPMRKPDKLVTSGLYRVSRNPMYLGQVLLLTGLAIYLGSAADLVIAAAFFLIMDLWYIRREEAVMLATFGSDYEDYCKRVRRWL